ncbi:unnamed protein product, partial [marine sediment metagenome]
IYPDVNLALFESLLRLEPKRSETTPFRHLASDLLTGKLRIPGVSLSLTVAPLLILRFGDRRSLPLLRRCFERNLGNLPAWAIKAAGVVYASHGISEYRVFRKVASQLGSQYLSDIVRFIERVMDYDIVPGRYKARLNLRFDAVSGIDYIDMRSLLSARILSLNRKTAVQSWLTAEKKSLLNSTISQYDKDLIKRLLP